MDDLTDSTTIGATLMPYDSVNNIATFTFPNLPLGALPNANFTATLAAGLQDSFGNTIDSPTSIDFFFLSADANHDRTVDTNDFVAMSDHFNQVGSFSQGDFNYDGAVDALDFNRLATMFGTTLPAPMAATLTAMIGTTGQRASSVAVAMPELFSYHAISPDFDDVLN